MFRFITLIVLLVGCSQLSIKSSDIPERREFPINSEVNPCDDYYEYTCSKVIDTFQLREDRSRHAFSFGDAYERMLVVKKDFLKDLLTRSNLNGMANSLKVYYQACMNKEAKIEEEQAWIKENWRALSRLKTRQQFQEAMVDRLFGKYNTYLDWGTIPNQENSEWMDVYLTSGQLYLPERSYYNKEDLMKEWSSLIEEFYTFVGHKKPKLATKWFIDFQKKFAELYPLPQEWRTIVSSNTYESREKMIKAYPHLRLKKFFEKIPKNIKVRNFTPEVLEYMNDLAAHAPLEQLRAILFYPQMSYLDDHHPEFFDKYFDFRHKYLGGPAKRSEREERCTREVMGSFKMEIDYLLIKEKYPSFPAGRVRRLAGKVRQSLTNSIKKNKWLSAEAKKEAYAKISGAALQVVKPRNAEEWHFHPVLSYSPEKPIRNSSRFSIMMQKKQLKDLEGPVSKWRWGMSPLQVNAYYSPSYNKFVMPMGILQYPFFDQASSDEANLGAMGAVVGHELGHAIDDKGSRYDSKGRLRQWMTEADLKNFRKRGEQLIGQFNEIGHNGMLTLGENIGDLVGVRAAYRAAFPGGKGSEEKKREFFLGWGRTWCEVYREKYKEKKLKTDPHAMGKARVNEPLKHIKGFAEAYQCKESDKMVLKDRVYIW